VGKAALPSVGPVGCNGAVFEHDVPESDGRSASTTVAPLMSDHRVPRLSRSSIPYSTRSRMGSGCSPRYSTQAFFAHG
jgi:hypothetical protein